MQSNYHARHPLTPVATLLFVDETQIKLGQFSLWHTWPKLQFDLFIEWILHCLSFCLVHCVLCVSKPVSQCLLAAQKRQYDISCSDLYYVLLTLACLERATFCERPSQNSALDGPQQHLAITGKAKLFFTYSKVGQASCKAFILREALRHYGEIQPLRKTREIECRQPLGADPRSDDCSKTPLRTLQSAFADVEFSRSRRSTGRLWALSHWNHSVWDLTSYWRALKPKLSTTANHVSVFSANCKASKIIF